MAMFCAIAFCIILKHGLANQIQYPSSSQDLNQLIEQHLYVLAYFRQEQRSCPDCNRVLLELVDASKYIDGHQIAIASINCTVSKQLCEPFNVPLDYPSLKFFDSATVIDYYGNYDWEAILSNIRRLTGPILTELNTADGVHDFVAKYNESMIMFVNGDGSDALVSFASAATHLRANVTFAYSSMSVLSELDIEFDSGSNSAILFYTTLRSDPVFFLEKDISAFSLQRFLSVERFPVISNVHPDTYPIYVDRGLPIVWCFLAPDDKRSTYLNILKRAAKKSRSELSWVWLDAVEHGNHAANLGLDLSWPSLVVDDIVAKTKFMFPAGHPFDDINISSWIEKVLSRQVQPHIRSERPFPVLSGSLIRAVGENYAEITSDTSKDVFIIVTSKSWCGASKVVDPQVLMLADIFKDQRSILIVEIDGSLNDVPLDIVQFPSIFFYAAGERSKLISYQGTYSVAALSNFILEHSRSLTQAQRQAVVNQLELLLISSRSQEHSKRIEGSRSETTKQTSSEKDEL